MLACFSLLAVVSSAQTPARHSAIPLTRAKADIRHYQGDFCWYPASFALSAYDKQGKGIGDYLNSSHCPGGDQFLHIYFGEKESTDPDQPNKQVLVITGASYVKNYKTNFKHLANDWQHSPVWSAMPCEAGACVQFDCDFDFDAAPTKGPCDLSAHDAGVEDRKTAAAYIRKFQSQDCNLDEKRKTINEAESFIINTSDLKEYLCRNPQVKYLQFYAGYRPFANELTIFITGLDKKGHHVWSKDDRGVPYLFGNAVACPSCSIDFDETLDYHHQGPLRFCEAGAQ